PEILLLQRCQESSRIAAALGNDAQTDRRPGRNRAHVSAIARSVACDSYAASISARERRLSAASHGGVRPVSSASTNSQSRFHVALDNRSNGSVAMRRDASPCHRSALPPSAMSSLANGRRVPPL